MTVDQQATLAGEFTGRLIVYGAVIYASIYFIKKIWRNEKKTKEKRTEKLEK